MPRSDSTRSWYLDPIVARQKQAAHLDLVHRWIRGRPVRLLKTDLFEEANGADQLLWELRNRCGTAIGLDVNFGTVDRARLACPGDRCPPLLAADVRALPLNDGCIDVIVSSSTLDHFDTKADFGAALEELSRVLRPGGSLVVSLDNPLNPLYWPLKWLSVAGPIRLGYTPSPGALRRQIERLGLRVIDSATLIHNPRLISTLLFLALRRVLGRRADPLIHACVRSFASLERLPTRRFTCCFYAVLVRKPN